MFYLQGPLAESESAAQVVHFYAFVRRQNIDNKVEGDICYRKYTKFKDVFVAVLFQDRISLCGLDCLIPLLVDQVDLEQRYSSLCLLSAEIIGVYHHQFT